VAIARRANLAGLSGPMVGCRRRWFRKHFDVIDQRHRRFKEQLAARGPTALPRRPRANSGCLSLPADVAQSIADALQDELAEGLQPPDESKTLQQSINHHVSLAAAVINTN
jgi:hypothetical protein